MYNAKYVYANDMLIYRERRISQHGISVNTMMQILSNFASPFANFLTSAGGNMKRIRNDVGKKFLREDVQSFFDISIRSRILSIFTLDTLIFYMEVEIRCFQRFI